MSSPILHHWQDTKRIMGYLQGTIHHCLHIKHLIDFDLIGFSYVFGPPMRMIEDPWLGTMHL